MASSPAARRAASAQRNAQANDTLTSQSSSLISTHTKLAHNGVPPSAPAAVKTMRASVSECKSRMLTELTGVVANMRRQGGAVVSATVAREGGDGGADRELSGAAMALHVCRQHWGMLENDLSESVSTQEHTIASENAQMRSWLIETQSLVEELSGILFSSRTPHYTPPQAANDDGTASGEDKGGHGEANNNNSSNKLNIHQNNRSSLKMTSPLSGMSKGHIEGQQVLSSSSSLPRFAKLVDSVRAITHKAKSLQQELYAVSHREDFGPPPSTWLEDKNSPNPHSSPPPSAAERTSADNNNKSTNNDKAFSLADDVTTVRGEVEEGRDEDDGIMGYQTRRGAHQHHHHEWVTTDLSLETLVRLAEDKQLKATRHILSRALENNNNLGAGSIGGGAIDVAEALKEMSQDLRVQLSRVQKELEEERHQSVAAAKAHKEALVKTEARYESIIGDLKRRQAATVEKFTKTIAGQQEVTVSNASQMWENIMIEFATRLSNFRGSELSRAVAMESLKEVLLAERQKVEGVYELPDVDMAIEEMLEEERKRLQEEQLQRDKEREAQLAMAAAWGSTAAVAMAAGGGNSFYHPTDDDPHSVWSPQSAKTVAALSTLVKSRQSELNIVLAGHRASLRVTGLEWETALHDVIAKYEAALAHLRETSPQAVLDNLKKNVSDLTEELEETRAKYSEVLKDFVEAKANAEAAAVRESILRSDMASLASQLEEAKKVAARRVSVAREAIGQMNNISSNSNNPVAGEVNTSAKAREDVLGNEQTAASTTEEQKSSASLSPFLLRLHKASQTTDDVISPTDTAAGLPLSLLPTSAEVPVSTTHDGVTNEFDLSNGETRNPSLPPSDVEASIHPPQSSLQQNGTGGYCTCGRPYPPPTKEAPDGAQSARVTDTPSSEALRNQGSSVSSDRQSQQQETSPRLATDRRMQTENEEHPTSGRVGGVPSTGQSKSRKQKEFPMHAEAEGASQRIGTPNAYNDVRNQSIGVDVTNSTTASGQERTANACIGANGSTGLPTSGGEASSPSSLEHALHILSNAYNAPQIAAPHTTRRGVMNPLPENTSMITTARAADSEAESVSRRRGSLSLSTVSNNREVSLNSAGSKVLIAPERFHSNMANAVGASAAPTHGGTDAVDGAAHLVEHLYYAGKHTPYSRQPPSLDVAFSRLLGEERFYSWLCKTASMLSYYSVRDAKAQGGTSTSVGRSNDVFLRSVRPFAPKHCYADAQRPPIRPITLVEATAMMHSCILLSNGTAETYYSDSRCASGLAELKDLLESLCRQCAGHGISVDLRSVPPNIISDYLSNPASDSAMRPVIMAPLFNSIIAIVKLWHVIRVRGGGGTWEEDQGGEAFGNDGRATGPNSTVKAADGIARTRTVTGGKAIVPTPPPPSAPSPTSIITVSNRSVGSLLNDRPGSARYIHHFVQAQKIRAASSARSASAKPKEGDSGGGSAISLPRLR